MKIKNRDFNNIFEYSEYNTGNKTFSFFDEEDYTWTKIVIGHIKSKLYLGEQPIKPFQFIYSDKDRSLTLNGITNHDEQRILKTLALNGLKPVIIIPNSRWSYLTSLPKSLFNQYKNSGQPSNSLEKIPLLQEEQNKHEEYIKYQIF